MFYGYYWRCGCLQYMLCWWIICSLYLTVHTTAMNNHICSQTTWISPIISKSLAVENYWRATDHWHCHSEMCRCKFCCYHFIFKNCHNACTKSITVCDNCGRKPEFFIRIKHNQNCAHIGRSILPRQPNDHPNLVACAHTHKLTDTSAWEFLYVKWNQNSVSCWTNNDSWPMKCDECKCTMHTEWQACQEASQAVPQAHN